MNYLACRGNLDGVLLSPEDLDLMEKIWLRPRKKHKRAGKRVMEVVWSSRKKKVSRLVLSRVLGRKLKRKELADHINGDTLNNRRDNLRVATAMQNAANRRKTSKKCTSKYKGVFKRKDNPNSWGVQMSVVGLRGKRMNIHVGYYDTEVEAALMYNLVAYQWYGDFALLNKVEGPEATIILPWDVVHYTPKGVPSGGYTLC